MRQDFDRNRTVPPEILTLVKMFRAGGGGGGDFLEREILLIEYDRCSLNRT